MNFVFAKKIVVVLSVARITLKKSNYRTSIPKEQISAAVKAAYSSDKTAVSANKDSKVTIVKKEASPAVRVTFVAKKSTTLKK